MARIHGECYYHGYTIEKLKDLHLCFEFKSTVLYILHVQSYCSIYAVSKHLHWSFCMPTERYEEYSPVVIDQSINIYSVIQ